jgi:hypothetical protein
MSEFDKLKDDAEQYGKDHPEQVQKGEQAAEKKLGLPEQGDSQPGQGNQASHDAQGQDAQGQDAQGQDAQGQAQNQGGGQDSSGQGQ